MRKLYLLISVFMLLFFSSTFAINFGYSSPDTGEADSGNNTGTFVTQLGSFLDTRTQNNVLFSMERSNGGSVRANQTLAFNISKLSTNTSLKIIGMNGTLAYCHARRADNDCTGGTAPQGTPGPMNILVKNVSGDMIKVGVIGPTTSGNNLNISQWNLSSSNYSSFINGSGFIDIYYEFNWTGSGRSSFLNDHANLTLIYDVKPNVTLSSPANASFYTGTRNMTFVCNTTDNLLLKNVTLYHTILTSFSANQTTNISGISNSTSFSVVDVLPGNYTWGCRVDDGVTDSVFTPSNYSFSIGSNLTLTSLGCTPSIQNVTGSVSCNASATDDLPITVLANVTTPSGILLLQTPTNLNSLYTFTFVNTSLNGTYTVSWSANDSTSNLKTAQSNFTIVNVNQTPNQIPVISNVALLPALAYTNNTLGCNFTITDDQTVGLSANITVYNYSSSLGYFTLEPTYNISVNNGTATTQSISPGIQQKNEQWFCSVVPYDGNATGTSVNSSSVTILNIAPDAPVLQFPEDGITVTQNSVVLQTIVTDIDADALTVSFMHNTSLLQSTSAVVNGSVVTYNWTGLVDGNYTWFVTVNDGSSSTSSTSHSFTVALPEQQQTQESTSNSNNNPSSSPLSDTGIQKNPAAYTPPSPKISSPTPSVPSPPSPTVSPASEPSSASPLTGFATVDALPRARSLFSRLTGLVVNPFKNKQAGSLTLLILLICVLFGWNTWQKKLPSLDQEFKSEWKLRHHDDVSLVPHRKVTFSTMPPSKKITIQTPVSRSPQRYTAQELKNYFPQTMGSLPSDKIRNIFVTPRQKTPLVQANASVPPAPAPLQTSVVLSQRVSTPVMAEESSFTPVRKVNKLKGDRKIILQQLKEAHQLD